MHICCQSFAWSRQIQASIQTQGAALSSFEKKFPSSTDTNEKVGTTQMSSPEGHSGQVPLLAQPTEPPNSQVEKSIKTIEATRSNKESWRQLEDLRALYDQGYITVTEYKDRKSQLVDNLTGTKSVSSSVLSTTNSTVYSRRPSQSSRSAIKEEFVPPRKPNWENVVPEKAVRYIFSPKTGSWSEEMIMVMIEKEPFAKGGLRKAYHLQYVNSKDVDKDEDESILSTSGKSAPVSFVAKISIDPDEDRNAYFADVEMQMYAKEWADKFNKMRPPKKISFVKAAVLELIERENSPLCAVERFIDGPYTKHNNNFGYVSEDDRNTPQAFSHFTFEYSRHTLLICDIQGVGDCYTDPQMHTLDGNGFGKGNLGVRGFAQFLATHRCNAICKYLRLPSTENTKPDDSGTIPYTVSQVTWNNIEVVEYKCYAQVPQRPATPRTPLLQNGESNASGCCCVIL
mmetsp:Transcript_10189/g.13981  ORF Transcript_10189/g.13981 Transcript_10189/m.13981 type:complete len:456 (-) Transcript_10189:41-1408(-)